MSYSPEKEIRLVARHACLPVTELVWRARDYYVGPSLEAWLTKRSCYRITYSRWPALQDHLFFGFYKRATRGREPWEHVFWCDRARIDNRDGIEGAFDQALEICTHHALEHGLLKEPTLCET